MALPLFVRNTFANMAWSALGRRERTAYYPLTACFLVTYRCELACVYCLENMRHRCPDGVARELDTAGVLRTLAGIRRVCDTIDISGGEPAMRSDLPVILAACRELDFSEIMLNTNGLRLDGDLAYLADVDCVMVGVDSLREEGFVRITGGTPDQHRRQLESLERLHRLQDEYGFDLNLCSVIVPGMLDEIDVLLDWCFERHVGVSISPWTDREFHVHEGLRRDPAYRELCERLVDYRRRGLPLAGTLGYYERLRDQAQFDCLPMSTLTLDPLGHVFWPCGEIQHPAKTFLEGKSYREIVDEARATWGPFPDCRDQCQYACHMVFPDLVARPWRLVAESLHHRSYRPFSARKRRAARAAPARRASAPAR
jgi:MoaA/NifB/PqqE/SkfB family radical SAM enzyme